MECEPLWIKTGVSEANIFKIRYHHRLRKPGLGGKKPENSFLLFRSSLSLRREGREAGQ
jgi:hypothetical protein